MAALSAKQQRFIEEYLIDLNGTQAAIRAGYSVKTADRMASENLRKPDIQKALQEKQAARAERTQITQDKVLVEIARLAFNDPRRAFDGNGNLLSIQDWPDEVAAAISSIKVTEVKTGDSEIETSLKEIKFWDKGAAQEKLCKHLGMYEKDNTQSQQAAASIAAAAAISAADAYKLMIGK
jgi:phage terminase small subunit